jgi:hypothetical protein
MLSFSMEEDGDIYPYSARTKRRKVKALVDNHVRDIYQNLFSPDFEGHANQSFTASLAHESEQLIERCCQDHLLPDSSEQAAASRVSSLACPADYIALNTIDNNNECDGMDDDLFYKYSSQDNTSDDNDYPLKSKLAEWAGTFNISHMALSGLLSILQTAGVDVPKDPRTLLATPKVTDVLTMAGGSYYYFGVENVVRQKMSLLSECECKQILSLHINIDGIPLSNSSSLSLWPIVGRITEFPFGPFLIAVYSGYGKPTSVNDFLKDFVNEMNVIQQRGLEYAGKQYSLNLTAVICDAPARAFVKCVKGHSGYSACERCVQDGVYTDGRMTFPETGAKKRTDDEFRAMLYEDHQTAISPFSQLDIGCVSNFPLDYMHLVCLGVVRRTILQWLKGPLNCRLSGALVNKISDNLKSLRRHLPKEFCRKPRSLSEVHQWKATEFRQFLLYTGLVVLSGLLPTNMYNNFKLLTVSLSILLSPTMCTNSDNCDYVQKLLELFITDYAKIYGEKSLVYNIHSLIHLPDDAMRYGALDNISAFPYETYLGKLKKLVRRPQNPVAQIVRRFGEVHHESCNIKSSGISQHLKKRHSSGPLPSDTGFTVSGQYKECLRDGALLSCKRGDNCYLVDGNVSLIRNICASPSGVVYVVCERFRSVRSFFTTPLDSAVLGMLLVSQPQGKLKMVEISHVQTKHVLLPVQDASVAVPLIHDV